jgi:hypothetical protein
MGFLPKCYETTLFEVQGNHPTWIPRDTFARILDGTSNTAIFAEKHIHQNNFRQWSGFSGAGGADNGYAQDVGYSHAPCPSALLIFNFGIQGI